MYVLQKNSGDLYVFIKPPYTLGEARFYVYAGCPNARTSPYIYSDSTSVNLNDVIEATQTAAKIQRMLAAGEPIIIRDGQLIDLALTDLQWWFLGVIANNEIFNPETSEATPTNDAHFHTQNFEHHLGFATLSYYWIRHNALYPLVDAGLIYVESNCHYLTDLGWQALKAGK